VKLSLYRQDGLFVDASAGILTCHTGHGRLASWTRADSRTGYIAKLLPLVARKRLFIPSSITCAHLRHSHPGMYCIGSSVDSCYYHQTYKRRLTGASPAHSSNLGPVDLHKLHHLSFGFLDAKGWQQNWRAPDFCKGRIPFRAPLSEGELPSSSRHLDHQWDLDGR
jgi:hypothetical protein